MQVFLNDSNPAFDFYGAGLSRSNLQVRRQGWGCYSQVQGPQRQATGFAFLSFRNMNRDSCKWVV